MTAPPVGESYSDLAFGTRVKRVSDARALGSAWVGTEYSTVSPWNLDNSRLILVHTDHFALYTGDGEFLRDLPIGASMEPRWSHDDPQTLFYLSGNQLLTFQCDSQRVETVRIFPEYDTISGLGEGDLIDGDHFALCGDMREVFIYQVSGNRKFPPLSLSGHSANALYMTPDANLLVVWNDSGTERFQGVELFDRHGKFLRQIVTAAGHMDVTRDIDGSEVIVWASANDRQAICQNGVVKVRLSDGQQACLLSLDWSLALHVSAPDAAGFVYVETYAPVAGEWSQYTNELLRVPLDGSEPTRLAHHRSSATSYLTQPRCACSRDGSRLVYGSDFGANDGSCEVYMIASDEPPRTIVTRRGGKEGRKRRPIPERIAG